MKKFITVMMLALTLCGCSKDVESTAEYANTESGDVASEKEISDYMTGEDLLQLLESKGIAYTIEYDSYYEEYFVEYYYDLDRVHVKMIEEDELDVWDLQFEINSEIPGFEMIDPHLSIQRYEDSDVCDISMLRGNMLIYVSATEATLDSSLEKITELFGDFEGQLDFKDLEELANN